MFERSAFGVAVRVSGGDIEVIKHTPLIDHTFGDDDLLGQFGEQAGHRMSPCLLAAVEM